MKQSVHKNLIIHYLLTVAESVPTVAKRKIQLSLLGVILTMAVMGQTYTTRADGNWSSATTWTGGKIPGTTVAKGTIINIRHAVTFDQSVDLSISGTVNITDTLKFGAAAKKDIKVNAGGVLLVNKGSIIQDLNAKANALTVTGGRVSFTDSYIAIGKTFDAGNGASRSFLRTQVFVGGGYSIGGTSSTPSVDSIQNSLIDVAMSQSGNFVINSYGTLRVANADIKVDNLNNFINNAGGSIVVLKSAANNYGFDWLKVTQDLQNEGSWNARIDAACTGNIIGSKMADIDFTRAQDCSNNPNVGSAPELIFKNPVLVKGKANSEGAVYRFPNVTNGVDGEIKLKNFSRNDIVMQSIDLPTMGWDKAFQPQFGLPGLVKPFQDWYIDFELTFYEAGTNKKVILPKVDLTALDVDGDGASVREYAIFQNPSNVMYSTITYLQDQPAGSNGQTFVCPVDGKVGTLITCSVCGGDGKTGIWNLTNCTACAATGLVYSVCKHPYDGTNGNVLQGPVENFVNIDTSATQVMATYQFTDVDFIAFRYGGKSGSTASNGAGIRLNSIWFRDFSLAPPSILPVKLTTFNAFLNRKDVKLSWTANEENVSHYVIQRSTDGKNYYDFAVIFASSASGTSSYTYNDANVSSSSNRVFYRLQMVDHAEEGGNYSETRVIRLDKESESLQLTTYPNPVADQLKITLPNSWRGKSILLQLFNGNGSMVQNLQIGKASQTETMQLNKLSTGFYLVKAICNGEIAQQHIIKN
jgi:Secretion system C-terminal sorting domain